MIKYIKENKQWIFSGIGVLVITLVIGFVTYMLSGRSSETKPPMSGSPDSQAAASPIIVAKSSSPARIPSTEPRPTNPTGDSQSDNKQKKDEKDFTLGAVLFADGREVRGCKISDHNPGPIGSGWNETSVGYCNSLDAALDHSTNRSRKFPYSRIQQIKVLPFNNAEKEIVAKMDLYDRDKILKCNVTFHDGSSMNGIFLLPHYLGYECANETGKIMRDTIKALIFYRTNN